MKSKTVYLKQVFIDLQKRMFVLFRVDGSYRMNLYLVQFIAICKLKQ